MGNKQKRDGVEVIFTQAFCVVMGKLARTRKPESLARMMSAYKGILKAQNEYRKGK